MQMVIKCVLKIGYIKFKIIALEFLSSLWYYFWTKKSSKMDTDQVIDFKGETLFEIILINYRWVLVCFFLLPMSFLYNLWFYMRNAVIFHFNNSKSARWKSAKSSTAGMFIYLFPNLKKKIYTRSKFRYKHGIKLISQRKCAPQDLLISRWVSASQHTNQICIKLSAI